jgi:hypothetical protein
MRLLPQLARFVQPRSRLGAAPAFTGPELAVAAIWAGMSAAALYFALHFTSPYLVWDEWELAEGLIDGMPDVRGLWSVHVDHCIPLPRIIFWALSRIFGPDPRAWSGLTVVILSWLAFVLVRTARRLRGRTELADAVFPLVLLNWGHHADLMVGFQLQFTLSVAMSVGWVLTCLRSADRVNVAWSAAAILLLPMCGSQGLVFVLPIAVWLGRTAVRTWRTGDHGRAAMSAGVAVVGLALIALSLHGPPAGEPTMTRTPQAAVRTGLEFLSLVWGVGADGWWPLSAVAAIALVPATAVVLLLARIARPADTPRITAVTAFLVGQLALAAAIGWGRCGYGPGVGFAARYTLLAAPLACVAAVAWTAFGGRRGSIVVPRALFIAAALAWASNTSAGLAAAREHAVRTWAFGVDVRAGLSAEEVAARHHDIYPHTGSLAVRLRRLRDAGVRRYAAVADGPP